MEVEDVQSDLQALKKLYGLVQSKGNNPQNNGGSQNLDEKAKLVLKKLLDGATKQIISEEQLSVTTALEDHQPKLQSLVSPDRLSKTSPPIHTIFKDSNKDINFNPITSQTRKRCRICGKNRDRDHHRNRNSSDRHHEVSIGSASLPINGLEAKEGAKGIGNTKKPKLSKIHDVKCNKEITGSQVMLFKSEPAGYTSFGQNKNKKQDSRPVGVAETIQQIEARIRANQQMLSRRVMNIVKDQKAIESKHQASKTSKLLELRDGSTHTNIRSHLAIEKDLNHKATTNALPPKTVISRIWNNLPSQSTSEIRKTKEATLTMDQKLSQKPYRFTAGMNGSAPIQKKGIAKRCILPAPGQISSQTTQTGRKPIRERSELSSHKTNLTNKSVLESVISPSQKIKKTNQSTLPTQISTQTTGKIQASTRPSGTNVLPQTTAKIQASQGKTGPFGTNVLARVVEPTPMQEYLMVPPQNRDLTRGTTNQYRRPLDVSDKLSRTKEYDKPRQHIILPTLLNGTHRNGQLAPPKTQMPYQPISSESESESASTSASYSTASDSITQEGSSSGSCSESDSDPQPRRMMTHHPTGPTSRYRSPNVGQTGEGTRSVEHDSMVSPLRHVSSTAITKSSNRSKGNEKEVGRLRRFKNKLGIIFHHHHHHHHHHHDGDAVATTTPDHRSLWKYLGDILHHRTSNKDNGRKSMVKNTPRQNQHGYLHTLVDGFIRHVRHSKKSNKSEADMKRLARNGSRKMKKKAVVKKWHWWQKLRGSSSNNGKTRVKVGFRANERPMLRAPEPN